MFRVDRDTAFKAGFLALSVITFYGVLVLMGVAPKPNEVPGLDGWEWPGEKGKEWDPRWEKDFPPRPSGQPVPAPVPPNGTPPSR